MSKTGGAIKRLTEKLKMQERNRLFGRHARRAILDKVDVACRMPDGPRPTTATFNPDRIRRGETAGYVAPIGKGGRTISRATGGDFKRLGAVVTRDVYVIEAPRLLRDGRVVA